MRCRASIASWRCSRSPQSRRRSPRPLRWSGATASVVAITSYADRIGTGVVIAEDRVLTVAHVVDAAEGTPTHVIAADTLLTYEVLAIDRERDLALLAVDLPEDVPRDRVGG